MPVDEYRLNQDDDDDDDDVRCHRPPVRHNLPSFRRRDGVELLVLVGAAAKVAVARE
jgi:hypothetical protein